mmetsp:Transcript_9478/g.31526  ORF Transcript_9478/g.31526 Transcript_9478/m.31526 type:complete len:256 (+) Transcript_9478:116-883(+)
MRSTSRRLSLARRRCRRHRGASRCARSSQTRASSPTAGPGCRSSWTSGGRSPLTRTRLPTSSATSRGSRPCLSRTGCGTRVGSTTARCLRASASRRWRRRWRRRRWCCSTPAFSSRSSRSSRSPCLRPRCCPSGSTFTCLVLGSPGQPSCTPTNRMFSWCSARAGSGGASTRRRSRRPRPGSTHLAGGKAPISSGSRVSSSSTWPRRPERSCTFRPVSRTRPTPWHSPPAESKMAGGVGVPPCATAAAQRSFLFT